MIEQLDESSNLLSGLDQKTKQSLRELIDYLRKVEERLRSNLGSAHAIMGAGVNPTAMGQIAHMHATALENTDRARALIMGLTGISAAIENVRANLATAKHRINHTLGRS